MTRTSKPAEELRDLGFSLFRARQPLGAAIFYVEAIRAGAGAEAWAELGCALADSAGMFVRTPFFEAANVAFLRATHLGLEGPLVSVLEERLASLAPELGKHKKGVSQTVAPADAFLEIATPEQVSEEALDHLQDFLVVDAEVVSTAVAALAPSERAEATAWAAELNLARFAPPPRAPAPRARVSQRDQGNPRVIALVVGGALLLATLIWYLRYMR